MEFGIEALPGAGVQAGRDLREGQGRFPAQARGEGQFGGVAFLDPFLSWMPSSAVKGQPGGLYYSPKSSPDYSLTP